MIIVEGTIANDMVFFLSSPLVSIKIWSIIIYVEYTNSDYKTG